MEALAGAGGDGGLRERRALGHRHLTANAAAALARRALASLTDCTANGRSAGVNPYRRLPHVGRGERLAERLSSSAPCDDMCIGDLTLLELVSRACCVAIGCWALTAAGCQTYRPAPLDLPGHIESWRQRNPDSAQVTALAQQLAMQDRRSDDPLDCSDGLSLREAELVALVFNPDLRLARGRLGVAAAAFEHAGRWDDPTIGVDIERIVQSVAEPWVISSTIEFTLPISGRLEAAKSLAGAEHALAIQQVALEEWQTVQRLRAAWVEWSALHWRDELAQAFVAQLEQIASSAHRLMRAGEMDPTQAALFDLELARRRIQMRLNAAQRREAQFTLRGLMGLAPDAIPDTPLLPVIALEPHDRDRFHDESLLARRSPRLMLRRAAYESAERALALEIRRQYPDLAIAPGYGVDEGDSRVLLGLRAPIPLFNANRQAIEEARAQREVARAAFETEYERLVIDLHRLGARYNAARDIRSDLEGHVAPLADQQLHDVRRLTDLGELDPLILLESIVRAYDTQLDLIDARLRESLAAIAIDELIGPPHAPSPPPAASPLPSPPLAPSPSPSPSPATNSAPPSPPSASPSSTETEPSPRDELQ